MIETTNPEIDVEKLVRQINDEVAKRYQFIGKQPRSLLALQNNLNNLLDTLAQPTPEPSAYSSSTLVTLSSRYEYSLSELTQFHGYEFVANAYQAIMLRSADPEGLGYFLDLLQRGESKVAILGRLRYSPEGRHYGVRIKGLWLTYTMSKLYRLPVAGHLLRTLSILIRLPTLERNLQIFEAHLAAQINQLNETTKNNFSLLYDTAQQRWDRLHAMLPILLEIITELSKEKADIACLQSFATNEQKIEEKLEKKINQINSELQQTVFLSHRLEEHIQKQKIVLLDQERRLGLLLEEVRKRLPAALDETQLTNLAKESTHLLDALYVNFEDRFRGTRDEIKQRMCSYLPIVKTAGVITRTTPLLDIGCGRGEWIELLKEHGLAARGIDLNRIMVEECKNRSLEVVEKDALNYLQSLPANSVGAITGIHIIEHLSLPILITLLDESLRVLVPGGLVIFETPNPENLIVGACTFYMDPTHRNPLPPLMTQYLLEARGFIRTKILRLQQNLQDPLKFLSDEANGVNELNLLIQVIKNQLFCAPDYGILGYKA